MPFLFYSETSLYKINGHFFVQPDANLIHHTLYPHKRTSKIEKINLGFVSAMSQNFHIFMYSIAIYAVFPAKSTLKN